MRFYRLRSFLSEAGSGISALVFFAFVTAVLWRGIGTAEDSGRTEQLRLTETAIRRAVVSYYAIEGCYPATFETLKDYYGLAVDERFYVDYSVFASNIMPDITVLEVPK